MEVSEKDEIERVKYRAERKMLFDKFDWTGIWSWNIYLEKKMKKICYSYFHHWMMFLLGNKIEYDNSL